MSDERQAQNRNVGAGRNAARRAFTLIELLVVIAVVVLLASLLLPGLGDSPSRQLRAQRVQCAGNIKQLVTAQLLYAVDHRGRFCPSYLDYASLELKYTWMGALVEYHGRADAAWLCPAASNPPPGVFRGTADAPWSYTDPVSGQTTLGCYAINGHLGLGANYKKVKDSSFKVHNVFHRESMVARPAQTPVFADAIYWNCGLEETDVPSRNLYEPQGNVVVQGGLRKVLTQIIARHGDFPASEAPRAVTSNELPGAINIAFVDGHAETVPLEQLWLLSWHKNWNPARVPLPHPPPR